MTTFPIIDKFLKTYLRSRLYKVDVWSTKVKESEKFVNEKRSGKVKDDFVWRKMKPKDVGFLLYLYEWVLWAYKVKNKKANISGTLKIQNLGHVKRLKK